MDHTRTMITFKAGNIRFTYRVGAIILHNGRVLCQQSIDGSEQFWFVPGGRAELRESATETLRREVREELGAEPTIGPLLYMLENFFTASGEQHHEIGLYFLVTFPPDSYFYQAGDMFVREEENKQLTFSWLLLDELEQFPLYPTFFQKALQSLPEYTMHIVHKR